MPEFIPRSEQRPIVDTSSTTLDLIYFDLVTLASNEQDIRRLPAHESLYVVLSGQVDIEVDGIMFEAVGRRADIWGGDADSVYAPVGANVRISARGAAAEVAIAGGLCDTRYAPFRITPDEVDAVNVGSSDTHSQRRIVHLLGQRQNGRCGNLLVSELYAGEGCWSGYPPHKHDTEDGDVETRHEELYHYRFQPETGFGSQITYDEDGPVKILMTRNGDTVWSTGVTTRRSPRRGTGAISSPFSSASTAGADPALRSRPSASDQNHPRHRCDARQVQIIRLGLVPALRRAANFRPRRDDPCVNVRE